MTRKTKAVVKRQTAAIELPAELEGELESYINRDRASASGSGGGMPWMSTKGGRVSFNQQTLEQPVRVIVIGAMRENLYYPSDYDPDNPAAPSCYALAAGVAEIDMAPPEDLASKESEKCSECWANVFGSSGRGKGKACKNNVRLVLLPYQEDGKYAKVGGARLSVPPIALSEWSAYALKVTDGLRAPLWAVITEIATEHLERGGFTMHFNFGGPVPKEVILDVKERVDSDGFVNLTAPPLLGPGTTEEGSSVRKTKVVRRKSSRH